MTVGAYLNSWLTDHARHTTTPRTYERYCTIVRLHLKPALGHFVHGPMNFPRMVKPVLNIAIGLNCGDYQ